MMHGPAGPGSRTLPWGVWAAGAFPLLVYLAAVDDVGGLWGDDALYIVLAKALAQGAGYVDLSSPGGAVVAPPPGFPALLSLVFRFGSDFPGNLVLLKLMSIVSASLFWVLSGVLLLRRSRSPEWMVPTVCLVAAIHPFVVSMLASTVMADFTYAFLAAASLLLADRYLRRDEARLAGWELVATAFLMGAAGFVRAVGVVLPMAALAYALVVRRRAVVRKAVALVALVVAMTLPIAGSYRSYGQIMSTMTFAAKSVPVTSASDVPAAALAQVASNARDLGLAALPAVMFWPPYASADRVQRYFEGSALLRGARSALALVMIVAVGTGFVLWLRRDLRVLDIYVALTAVALVLSPLPGGYIRYLLAILPFLIFYLVTGFEGWGRALAGGGIVPAVTVAAVLGTVGVSHAALVLRQVYDVRVRVEPQSEFYAQWRARMETYEWARQLVAGDGKWAVENPPQFYLYLEKRAVGTPQSLDEARTAGIRYLHVLCEGGGRWQPRPWWKDGSVKRLFASRNGRECVYLVSGG